MREWLQQFARGPTVPAVLLSLAFTAIAVELSPGRGEGVARNAVLYETGSLAPGAGENIAAEVVGSHPSASVHHLVIAESVRSHYHRAHDETVIVLRGQGRMTIGGEARAVRAGVTLLIPRGTVHSLRVREGPVEVISVFSPPFDGKDRIFVD